MNEEVKGQEDKKPVGTRYDLKSFAVLPAVARDDTRYAISGVMLEKDGSTVATDTRVLARVSAADQDDCTGPENPHQVIVPVTMIEEAARLVGKDQAPALLGNIEGEAVMFETSDRKTGGQVIEGQFPNYQEVIDDAVKRDPVFSINLNAGVLKIVAEVMEAFDEHASLTLHCRKDEDGDDSMCMVGVVKSGDRTLDLLIMGQRYPV